MLPLKHVTKHRLKSLFSPILTLSNNTFSSFSAATVSASSSSVSTTTCPTQSPTPFVITQNDVADSFKTWFTTHHNSSGGPLLHRIYQILSSSGDDFSAALTALNLPLSEHFVLQVLRTLSNHGDILSCLKFFDWAGRQPYFHHTRATFFAIFRVLTRANLKPLVLDFLNAFRSRVFAHRVRFNDTLVIGYAIAGKPEIALRLFGKMRFQGLDLDTFALTPQ